MQTQQSLHYYGNKAEGGLRCEKQLASDCEK